MNVSWRRRVSAAVGAGALLLGTAACGGGGGDEKAADAGSSSDSSGDSSASPSASSDAPSPQAAASDFVDPLAGGNKWLPLKAGTRWVREGTTKIGKREVTHQVVSTVTDVIREIDGVKTVAVLDEEKGGGEIVDKSIDFLAQDSDGNIWWMGGITEEYEAGRLVGIDEAWLDGKEGAKRGILVPADPKQDTADWEMAKVPGEKVDLAGFQRIQDKECVPFGCYDGALVLEEGKKSPNETEYKYYASGIGQIRNEPKKSHDEDVEKLVNLSQLSADGLTEASNEALRIDKAAAEEESKTFGDIKAARASS